MAVDLLPDGSMVVFLHDGEQYLVALLVTIHVEDGVGIQGVLELLNRILVGPVGVYAFKNDTS
mgnify:FL=1